MNSILQDFTIIIILYVHVCVYYSIAILLELCDALTLVGTIAFVFHDKKDVNLDISIDRQVHENSIAVVKYFTQIIIGGKRTITM